MKTRRKKINKSPLHPFGGRNARAKVFVIIPGDAITTRGVRGRTEVKRIVDKDGKRIDTVRVTAKADQLPPPQASSKPIAIRTGRVYTGAPRGKLYPYGSTKRGFSAPAELTGKGLLGRAGRAMKRVLVGEDA